MVMCNGILFSHKKKKIPFAGTRIDLETIIPSEVNHTEEDKYHMISLILESNFKK